ncbi:MAG: hypothetical protein WKF28_03095 [Rubrobacteraceae bacterium]
MITGYAQRALECADRALMSFERGRMTLIERVATEYGFETRRELDQDTQYLNIDADLDFDSDADPLAEDLMDRFSIFLYALEDRDIGHPLRGRHRAGETAPEGAKPRVRLR